MDTISSGIILPRNYGIHLPDSGFVNNKRGRTFVQPLSYALAHIMLERTPEIRARIQEFCERHSQPYVAVEESFVQAVSKREGTKNLLNFSRRVPTIRETNLAITDLRIQRGRVLYHSKTKSQNGYGAAYVDIPHQKRKPNIAFTQGRCDSLGNYYDEQKGDFLQMSHHLAAVHVLLKHEWDNARKQENSLGINLNDAFGCRGPPKLPFSFNFFDKELRGTNKERHQALTDIVLQYYLEEQSQYEANKQALDNPVIYSPEIIREITREGGLARFEVIRQREQTTTLDENISVATLATKNNIEQVLTKQGFHFSRYAREFTNTPFECVAKRYEPKHQGPVYNLVVTQEGLPLVVRRFLEGKVRPWTQRNEEIVTKQLADKIGRNYTSIDDVTRRSATTSIILPDENLLQANIHIPEILQQGYDMLRAQAKN